MILIVFDLMNQYAQEMGWAIPNRHNPKWGNDVGASGLLQLMPHVTANNEIIARITFIVAIVNDPARNADYTASSHYHHGRNSLRANANDNHNTWKSALKGTMDSKLNPAQLRLQLHRDNPQNSDLSALWVGNHDVISRKSPQSNREYLGWENVRRLPV